MRVTTEKPGNNSLGLPTSRSITKESTDPRTGTTTYELSGSNTFGTQYTRTVEVTPNSNGGYEIQGEGLIMSGPTGRQIYTVTPRYNPKTKSTTYTFQGDGPGQRAFSVNISGNGETITGQNLPTILTALDTYSE